MPEWKLLYPYHNPPGLQPGWYFCALIVGPKRKTPKLISHGPYPTEIDCRRIIGTEKPCHHCKGMMFCETVEDEQRAAAGEAAGGLPLCELCSKDFKKWHKKKHGKPPRQSGVQ